MPEMRTVPLELIDPPEASIRQHIPEELVEELATSILAVGLIEPLVCQAVGDRLRVIAGHRRWLACRRAGLLHVQVVVREPSDISVEAVQVQENIIRQDMTAAEEARLFWKIYQAEGEDLEKTAGRVRLSVSYVGQRLALLQGDPLVLEALDREDISLGAAQVLNTIEREDYRRVALDTAIRSGATIAIVKRWAAEYNGLGRMQTGEATPQREASTPASEPQAPAPVCCWFCEGQEELHRLRMVQVHDHCISAMEALMKRIGRTA